MSFYTFEQSYIDYLTSQKVTAFVFGSSPMGGSYERKAVAGTTIDKSNIVYYVADDGYQFDVYPRSWGDRASIGYQSPTGGFVYFEYSYDNPSKAKQTFTNLDNNFDKVNLVKLIPSQKDIKTKGVNDVFKIDNAVMRGIVNGNFNFFNGQENIDYGQFIIGLIELPFNIPSELVAFENEPIKLAGRDTDYKGDLLSSDILKISLGEITIPKSENNFLAFQNKTTILHLPYAESIALEADYVIGQTISIEYLVNLYDGLTIINISSSKINGVIATLNIDLNVSIPFGSVTAKPSRNDPKNVKLGADNGIKTAYIELLSNDAILENGFYTIPIIDETLIGNCKGFIKVEEVNLSSKATATEKKMILNELTNGIII